jgi:hypothetical protein
MVSRTVFGGTGTVRLFLPQLVALVLGLKRVFQEGVSLWIHSLLCFLYSFLSNDVSKHLLFFACSHHLPSGESLMSRSKRKQNCAVLPASYRSLPTNTLLVIVEERDDIKFCKDDASANTTTSTLFCNAKNSTKTFQIICSERVGHERPNSQHSQH